jgi:hypothetical protein
MNEGKARPLHQHYELNETLCFPMLNTTTVKWESKKDNMSLFRAIMSLLNYSIFFHPFFHFLKLWHHFYNRFKKTNYYANKTISKRPQPGQG